MTSKRSKKAAAPAKTAALATAVAQDGSVDPTLLTAQVTIAGKVYTLCFDLGTLSRGEHELRAAGYDVNLLQSLPADTLEHVLVLFAVAIRRFHPEIAYPDALKIPSLPHVFPLRIAIADAWARSLAAPEAGDKQNPTQPGS
jgi:hypothetical protein